MMVLRRTNGSFPLMHLRDEMNRLANNYLGAVPGDLLARAVQGPASFPALNVWEHGDELYAEAEVPGLKVDDLDISVIGGDLTIRGRRGGSPAEGSVAHRQERGTGEFTRVLRLPIDVDAAKVEASLKDGVLLIKLPKAESAKPKKIKVSTGQ
jgi:HSP20 family protein